MSSDFNPGSLRETRSNPDCSCRICEIAKLHPHKRRDGKHRQTRQVAHIHTLSVQENEGALKTTLTSFLQAISQC